jgi:hypothetical protein
MKRLIGDNIIAVNGEPVLDKADFLEMEDRWHPGMRMRFEITDPRQPGKSPKIVQGKMDDGVPFGQNLLVVPDKFISKLNQKLAGRSYEPLFSYPAQDLMVYEVKAAEQKPAVQSR